MVYFLFTAILMNRQLFITHVPQVLMAFDYILLMRTCIDGCMLQLAIGCSNGQAPFEPMIEKQEFSVEGISIVSHVYGIDSNYT